MRFESESYHFHSWKCIWKCHLPEWQPFCPGGDELTYNILTKLSVEGWNDWWIPCCMDGLLERYVWEKAATLLTIPYTVYSRYIAVVYIAGLDIWRSHIGPHFLATHFPNFVDMAPKSGIFREIAVMPWTPFVGDSFSRNLLTAVAFDPARRRQFFTKSALGQSGLPVKCGREHMLCDGQQQKTDHWHLHCRVLLIWCPCKSVPQTTDQGKTNAFLIK